MINLKLLTHQKLIILQKKKFLLIFIFLGIIFSFVSENKILMANEYIGCYKDSGDPFGLKGRDLNGFMYSDPKMTVEKCISLCKQKGFFI